MNTNLPPMRTTVGHDEAISTVTDHVMVVTFRHRGWLFTLIADQSGDDFFVDHLTGRHIKMGMPAFDDLTDAFNARELWDV